MTTVPGVPPEVPTRPHRRLGTVGATLVLLACATLPWVVPQLPGAVTRAYDRAAPAPVPRPDPQPVAAALAVVARDAVVGMLDAPPTYLPGRLTAAGTPVRVRVPALGLDAPVVPISGQGGQLVPPSDPLTLGWWREGRTVGAPAGAAVITGHTVHTGGGALDALGTLRRDDTFTVQTAYGLIDYIVRWQHDYPTTELAARSHRLFGQDDFARLVLVTCSHWNGHGYDDNSVVLARPVRETPVTAP